MSAEPNTEQRKTRLTGGIGFLMVVLFCLGPAVIGAIGGLALGGRLGIAAAVVIALVAVALHWRSRRRGRAR